MLPLISPMVQVSACASCIVLASRSQYAAGHVWIPDLAQPVAAIWMGDRFYSFFKIATSGANALHIVSKLGQRNEQAVLTKAVGGYAIWVLELEASPTRTTRLRHLGRHKLSKPAYCQLAPSTINRAIAIHVPDLDKLLNAVYLNNRYYSIFRIEDKAEKALELAAKITQRGDETAIVALQQGYAVCVWEPEATLAGSAI